MTATAQTQSAKGHMVHMGIAEAGKLAALRGDHGDALRHYREALRRAQAGRAPEVFFRHYTQCVLESLELSGAHAEVIDFCDRALAHYETLGTLLAIQKRDRAATGERLALNLLKSGDADRARSALESALQDAARDDLPVARTVLGWLQRGMTPDARRLRDLQAKHAYFTVRNDQVSADTALPLPPDTAHPPPV
ncbi:MAG: hypothetical protein OIF47_07025 [Marinibacterium sp.]|nr:hypothetical protein [Marinibacterium sp.]